MLPLITLLLLQEQQEEEEEREERRRRRRQRKRRRDAHFAMVSFKRDLPRQPMTEAQKEERSVEP